VVILQNPIKIELTTTSNFGLVVILTNPPYHSNTPEDKSENSAKILDWRGGERADDNISFVQFKKFLIWGYFRFFTFIRH
jgi:hypothetical protein